MFIRLGLLVAAIHVYFLWSLGAGFYYDSVIYAQLGEALLTEGGLHAFIRAPDTTSFSIWLLVSRSCGAEPSLSLDNTGGFSLQPSNMP